MREESKEERAALCVNVTRQTRYKRDNLVYTSKLYLSVRPPRCVLKCETRTYFGVREDNCTSHKGVTLTLPEVPNPDLAYSKSGLRTCLLHCLLPCAF